MYPQGGRQPEFDFEQVMGRAREGWDRISRRLGGGGIGLVAVLLVGLIVAIWLATGIYTIGPGEQAALRLFGDARATPVTDTGLHWWWPRGVGSTDKVLVSETRRMELGFRGVEGVDTTIPVLEGIDDQRRPEHRGRQDGRPVQHHGPHSFPVSRKRPRRGGPGVSPRGSLTGGL